jgi:hypothetical protein
VNTGRTGRSGILDLLRGLASNLFSSVIREYHLPIVFVLECRKIVLNKCFKIIVALLKYFFFRFNNSVTATEGGGREGQLGEGSPSGHCRWQLRVGGWLDTL